MHCSFFAGCHSCSFFWSSNIPGRQRKRLEITPAEFYSNVVDTEEMCAKYLQDKCVLRCENSAICRRIKSDSELCIGELVQGTRKRKLRMESQHCLPTAALSVDRTKQFEWSRKMRPIFSRTRKKFDDLIATQKNHGSRICLAPFGTSV